MMSYCACISGWSVVSTMIAVMIYLIQSYLECLLSLPTEEVGPGE